MRRFSLPLMAACLLAIASPVRAGVGLPKLATLQVGHRTVAIHSDSAMARTGSNVLTVEVADWAEGAEVASSCLVPAARSSPFPCTRCRCWRAHRMATAGDMWRRRPPTTVG